MGSFFDKLFGRFVGSRKRTVNSRKLRVESLERRQLMVSDLGAISGTVYTDVTDNGLLGGDDALLSNVTVRLYRDGGNTNFDNGGADDTLVGTTTTNVNGVYTFNDLIAGKVLRSASCCYGCDPASDGNRQDDHHYAGTSRWYSWHDYRCLHHIADLDGQCSWQSGDGRTNRRRSHWWPARNVCQLDGRALRST